MNSTCSPSLPCNTDEALDVILNTQEQNVDYTEYRYRYIYMQPIPHTRKVGKTTTTYFTYKSLTALKLTSPDEPNNSIRFARLNDFALNCSLKYS